MEFIACNAANYRAGRTQPVRYIVMHYTANNGDTAQNNCDYYHRVGGLQASAHYFVDEYGAMQSVREVDTAWHCGARAYWHPECRNANSIGIEMCSRKRADGSYYIKPETVANAAALARDIMQRYGIDTDRKKIQPRTTTIWQPDITASVNCPSGRRKRRSGSLTAARCWAMSTAIWT